jgi:hypothetical protein
MNIDLAKEIYRDEWARRDQLTGNVGMPITVMTAVGGGVALMIKSFELDVSLGTYVFSGAVSAAVFCLLYGAYSVARSYHGYTYKQIPSALQLNTFCSELKQYHTAVGSPPEHALREFDEYLRERYLEAAEKNSNNNISKAAYLYNAAQSIILSLACAAIAVVPWSNAAVGRETPPERVLLEYSPSTRFQTRSIVTHPTSPETPPAPPPPTRPSGPPNRDIREGEQPNPRPLPTPQPRRG